MVHSANSSHPRGRSNLFQRGGGSWMEKPDKLYHGSRYPEVLKELRAQNYEQIKNGVAGHWLFATHRIDQAILFATHFGAGGSFLTTLDERTESGALLLFVNETSASYFSKPVRGFVYELPTEGFEQVKNAPREWVHAGGIHLPQQRPLAVTSCKQVMVAGVQVFTLHPDAPKTYLAGMLENGRESGATHGGADAIGRLLAQPNSPLVWQNHEHKTGMDQSILRAFMDASRLLARRKYRPFQL